MTLLLVARSLTLLLKSRMESGRSDSLAAGPSATKTRDSGAIVVGLPLIGLPFPSKVAAMRPKALRLDTITSALDAPEMAAELLNIAQNLAQDDMTMFRATFEGHTSLHRAAGRPSLRSP